MLASLDPDVIGRTVTVNGGALMVIGVAPSGFNGTHAFLTSDVWLPAAYMSSGSSWMILFGRLSRGVTLEQAQAKLSVTGPRVPTERPGLEVDAVVLEKLTGLTMNRSEATAFMTILLATTVLVLLIVAINLTGMLLARALARRREIAVRLALGGGRARVARQLVIETLMLFGLGAGAGLSFAVLVTRALRRIDLSLPVSVTLDFQLDARVLAFSVSLALAAALVAGVVSALRATRHGVIGALRQGAPTADVGTTRLRAFLVVAQVVATVVLLIASSLFIRALDRMLDVETGYDTNDTVVARVAVEANGYDGEHAAAFFARLYDRLEARPEIVAVGGAMFAPLSRSANNTGVRRADRLESDRDGTMAQWGYVDGTWFEAAATRILAGRSISTQDVATDARVVVINQTLAKRLWPGGDALGRRLVLNGEREVIGIAANGRYISLGEAPRAYAYLPLPNATAYNVSVYVRSRTTAAAGAGSAARGSGGARPGHRPALPDYTRCARRAGNAAPAPRRLIHRRSPRSASTAWSACTCCAGRESWASASRSAPAPPMWSRPSSGQAFGSR